VLPVPSPYPCGIDKRKKNSNSKKRMVLDYIDGSSGYRRTMSFAAVILFSHKKTLALLGYYLF